MKKTGGLLDTFTVKHRGASSLPMAPRQLSKQKETITLRVNVWAQKNKIIKRGREERHRTERHLCSADLYMLRVQRGRIISLQSCLILLYTG